MSLILVLLASLFPITTLAQFPGSTQLKTLGDITFSADDQPQPQSLSTVQSQDSGHVGNLDYTTVRLDGKPLFLIAVLGTGINSHKGDDSLRPVEYRKHLIESRLHEIIQRGFDPNTLSVTSSILNGLTVIQASDDSKLGKHILLTITGADAQLYAQSAKDVARVTAHQVKEALIIALQERQPPALKRQIVLAGGIVAIMTLLSLMFLLVYRWLGHRRSILKLTLSCIAKAKTRPPVGPQASIDIHLFDEVNDQVSSAPWLLQICDQIILFFFYCFFGCKRLLFGGKKAADKNELNQTLLTAFNNQKMATQILKNFEDLTELGDFVRHRLNQLIFVRRLLFLCVFLVWVRGVAVVLQVFPTTRWQGQQLSGTPLSLILIWLSVLLIVKISDSLINFFFQAWAEDSRSLDALQYSRNNLRINTLNGAVRGVNLAVFIFGGFVLSLALFNVPVTTILAGAGILGFAISFGSQNLIRDLIAGISNLLNDSFAVNDVVEIGGYSGTVENTNLFVTRIRRVNGDLVTIPNGSIGTVCNQTKDWSRVDFSVMVAADINLKKAIIVLRQTALDLYHDNLWRQKIMDLPDFKGVEDISHQGILLRLWLKTLPGEQWAVARELRLRVKGAFEAEHIAIGIPQQKWLMDPPPETDGTNDLVKVIGSESEPDRLNSRPDQPSSS